MEPQRDSPWARKGLRPSNKSIVVLFVLGFLLMGLPVLLVIYWPSSGNCSDVLGLSVCQGTRFYRASIGFLPYVMVIGTVLAGYNMKRIADWNTLDLVEEPYSDKNRIGP